MNTRWWLLCVIGSIALSQALFWDRPAQRLDVVKTPEPFLPANERYDSARAAALSMAFGIQAARLVERYSNAAVAGQSPTAPIHFGPAEMVDEPFRFGLLPDVTARAQRQLALWGLQEPRVALGVYRVAYEEGWPQGLESVARPPSGLPSLAVAGRLADGSGYCVQIAGVVRSGFTADFLEYMGIDTRPTGPGAFGPCWPYARYGIPGPGVAAWMAATGMDASWSTEAEDFTAAAEEIEFRLWAAAGARVTLWLPDADVASADRCIHGDEAACLAAFLTPQGLGFDSQERAIVDAVPLVALPRRNRIGFLPSSFLHDLEAEYGPERMQAFWDSDADVVTAFETAFSVDLEATMMEVGRDRFGYEPTGPSAGLWGWIGLFAALTLGLASGIRAMDRRAVA